MRYCSRMITELSSYFKPIPILSSSKINYDKYGNFSRQNWNCSWNDWEFSRYVNFPRDRDFPGSVYERETVKYHDDTWDELKGTQAAYVHDVKEVEERRRILNEDWYYYNMGDFLSIDLSL